MFTTVSRNGTWHCFKVCTFRFQVDFVVFRIFDYLSLSWPVLPRMIRRSKNTDSAKNEIGSFCLFACKRLWNDCGGKSADYFEFPSVEFEFSKWWNAHETNAITSRFNPFKPFRFLRFVPVKRENMHQSKCIKVQTISKIIQNSLFIIVYSKMHVTEKPTAVR